MTKSKLPADAPSDPQLEICRPKTSAAGLPSLTESIPRALREMEPERSVKPYPTAARGCVSAYFPEANVLVSLESTAEGSNTPMSKSVVVRLEPARAPEPARAAAP